MGYCRRFFCFYRHTFALDFGRNQSYQTSFTNPSDVGEEGLASENGTSSFRSLLTTLFKMKKQTKKENVGMTTMLDGVMTFGKNDNGLNMLDFMCTELAEIAPFVANCKVQAMHDGNVYITELPKRIHNTPLFREDNSTLTLGRDGKYYFVFTMPAGLVADLPDKLTHQALAIAQKVERVIRNKKEVKK